MQTYTHLAVGALMATYMFPDNYAAQGVFALGSIAPDFVMVPSFVRDKFSRKQPLAEQSTQLLEAKEISHSLSLWGIVWLFPMYAPSNSPSPLFMLFMEALFTGALIHIIIDVFTHCSLQFRDTEPSFCWPLEYRLGEKLGIWDYRYKHGQLWPPKPFEAIVNVVSVAAIIFLKFSQT